MMHPITDDKAAAVEHVDYRGSDIHPKEKDEKMIVDLDENLDRFGSHVKTDPAEIALVRKLDIYMMPILCVMYFLNFLDQNAMINGKLNGLDKDLKLKGTEYNTLVSILFVGYLLGQVPSNMVLNRVKPGWYMSGFMMAWAIVSTLTCLVHDFKGMLVSRLLLGISEAPFYPGALYMISQFYTRKEVTARMAVFYTGNMLASLFSSLIAAGVFAGLDGVQGVVTVGVAFCSIFLLPNSLLETKWLTPEERQLAPNRIERDTTGRRALTSTWIGFREAVSDHRTWIFCLMINLYLFANGFKNFMPTVKTLGFNTTITLVLTCPPFLVATFVSVLVSWSSGKFNERTWHITISKAIAILGFAIAWGTLNIGARYFAMVLFVGATYGVNNIGMGWVALTLGQTNEKKALAVALSNTLGEPRKHAPRVATAMAASIAFSVGTVICAWVMRFDLMRENKKIRAQENEAVNFYVY
ncbi:putative MFS transporter [Cadophora sp. MPI-SDFR-AT-0126]|nr:putative MFS transporter [Leotiomycetes sp. MPI-SDFR-AT-0126]